MPIMTGSRFFAEAMRGHGVSHIFFVPTMMLPALAEMEDMGIRRVTTHGEKAAAYMADGYARASGRPGICLAQNVGAANLAAGLRDAYMACSPVISCACSEMLNAINSSIRNIKKVGTKYRLFHYI